MYPETVLAGERWLDANSGRGSVHAAVLRAADGRGYARGLRLVPRAGHIPCPCQLIPLDRCAGGSCIP